MNNEVITKEVKPYFWKHKQGRIQYIIKKFLNKRALTHTEFKAVKNYVRQWMKWMFDKQNAKGNYNEELVDLLIKIDLIKTQNQLYKFIEEDCSEIGLNPF